MITPPNGHTQKRSLPNMLYNDSSPVVSKRSSLKCLDERDTHKHACDHDKVRYGEDECVTRDKVAERRREKRSVGFP